MRLMWLTLLCFLGLPVRGSAAPRTYPTRGIVVQVNREAKQIAVSCDAIPDYMSAMVMSYTVADAQTLAGLQPGAPVTFLTVPHGKTLYAEHIRRATTASFGTEPLEAGNLAALAAILDPPSSGTAVQPGEPVPNFTLTDQTGSPVQLSQFQGKVVALTFGYSRCPRPDFCLRLSDNLARLQTRFHADAGRNLVLLTIAIDPEHDHGKALDEYAGTWKADPAIWHFLTGPLPDVKAAASLFGMNFWTSEGLLIHPLHTAVLDRRGHLVVNWEGNHFTAQQLGDLVDAELHRL